MAYFTLISENLIIGKIEEVKKAVKAALDEGVEPVEILNKGLMAGMDEVSSRFQNQIFFIPEVIFASRAMHGGMNILRPKLSETGVKSPGKIAFGTVQGDLHDIGKNLVYMMVEGAGFEVIDMGFDVPPEKFVEIVQQSDVDMIAMSALLTTTMPAMKTTIEALQKAGLTGKVKAIIGGVPVNQDYADEIGADGYAPDAKSAVDKVKELLGL